MKNSVDLPWYTSLWRLKECHLLLFRCCLLFVVLNNDLMIFICRPHGFSDEPLLLRHLPWYCGLHQQHARGHCILVHVYCTSTRKTTQKYKWKLTHSLRRRGYGVNSTQKYKLGLKVHCVIFRMIHRQKCNIIYITTFSEEYKDLT